MDDEYEGPWYRHSCFNENCDFYLDTQMLKFRKGDRVEEKATGRIGTVSGTPPCESCGVPLTEER